MDRSNFIMALTALFMANPELRGLLLSVGKYTGQRAAAKIALFKDRLRKLDSDESAERKLALLRKSGDLWKDGYISRSDHKKFKKRCLADMLGSCAGPSEGPRWRRVK